MELCWRLIVSWPCYLAGPIFFVKVTAPILERSDTMRIKELSEKYNIDKRTIDYYSSIAKILPFTQNEETNNYREYDENSERTLVKILVLRELGLSIKEIQSRLNDKAMFTPKYIKRYISELTKKRDEEWHRIDDLIGYAEEL